jgi:hypothetical protein
MDNLMEGLHAESSFNTARRSLIYCKLKISEETEWIKNFRGGSKTISGPSPVQASGITPLLAYLNLVRQSL